MTRGRFLFVRPCDAKTWRPGDQVRTCGVVRIVTWVGRAVVELAPATWWRRAWYWICRKAGP